MRPVRRFEVRPTIPDALAALPGLATNLHWAWDREAVRLFERIWPGWTAGDAHPAHMVRTTSSERLAALAEDQAVVRDLAAAKGRLEAAITGPTWFANRATRLAARHGRLLLARVRRHRGPAAVLRRPRRALRRPPQGVLRPRRAARRHRPAVHRGLLPPGARRRRLAAGAHASTWTPSRSGSPTPACA